VSVDPATRPRREEQLPAEDDATEVAPGVVRIQLPILLPGLGHVNCYVLEDGDGVTLVDPGLPGPEAHADLVARLDRLGVPAHRVHTVLVTHSHPDHFGGAGRLRAQHGCDVVAHRDFATPFDRGEAVVDDDLLVLEEEPAPSAAPVEEPTQDGADLLGEVLFGEGALPELPPRLTPWGGQSFRPSPEELAHMRTWDALSKQGLLSLRPTRTLDDRQFVTLGRREWQVLHTPGHTGDHICLFDPDAGTLLSGDHVLPTITPHISGLSPGPDALAQFFDNLERVAQLEGVTTVLPAHGLPFSDLPGRVTEIIEHHDDRLATLRQIVEGLGDAPVEEHSKRLFRERSWGPMAESETYAHLEHLRRQGWVRARRQEDGRVHYGPAEPVTTPGS
jgi:glyoxylase-like metal-dependent hydrolase (beta-lactamase superfamily II)